MLKPSDIIAIATYPQRHITAAIKLAAALLDRGSSISEAEARSIIKMDDLAWTNAKGHLGSHFVFSRGRIAFPTDAEPIDPWDAVSADELARMDKKLDKLRNTKPAAPLTPIQQTLYSLGGMTERQAVGFYYAQAAKYGHEATIAAINVAAQARPGEPKAYIIAILRKAALAASPASISAPSARRFPTRVLRYKPPVNPEAARTEFLGWEAPDANPEAPWPKGVRRKLYRLTTGEITYEMPPPGETPPTAEADPGCLVIS